MTAKELKNSILQLAVQGKLVSQNSNDEPASELLKRIQAEKARLIKEGVYVIDKKHTAEPIKEDDFPHDLPNGWEWVRFADIVAFNTGKTPPRQTTACWENAVCPWVSIADMVADGITLNTKEGVSEKAIRECFSGKISSAGTMIMSFKLTIGKVSILGIDAVHNEAIISVFPFARNEDKEILQKYLFKILPLIAETGDSKNAIKGKTLNSTSISNLLLPIPPLAEQQRIVDKIEELLPLIEEYGKAETRLKELNADFPDMLRKSILQEAVQGKLTERNPEDEPASELLKRIQAEKARLIKEGKLKKEKPLSPIAEEEIPFDVFNGWEWVKLGDMVSVFGGKRIPAGRTLTTENTGHKYIRVSDMKNCSVLTKNLMFVPIDIYPSISNYIIRKEDVYITVAGTIGKAGKIPPEIDGANLTENADRLVFNFINQDWLIMCIESPVVQQQITEATKKVGQPKLAIKRIQELLIPLPPLDEQKRIVARVEELLALCDKLRYVQNE